MTHEYFSKEEEHELARDAESKDGKESKHACAITLKHTSSSSPLGSGLPRPKSKICRCLHNGKASDRANAAASVGKQDSASRGEAGV